MTKKIKEVVKQIDASFLNIGRNTTNKPAPQKQPKPTKTPKTPATPKTVNLPAPVRIASPKANPISAPILDNNPAPVTLEPMWTPNGYDGSTVVTEAYGITVNRGQRDGTVSEQWYARPDDQRFTSMDMLGAFLKQRELRMTEKKIKVDNLSFETHSGRLMISDGEKLHTPTHFSFQQLCDLLPAPGDLVRKLSTGTASLVMRELLAKSKKTEDEIKLYAYDNPNGDSTARSFTVPNYGRINDYEMFNLTERLTRGESHWKVPGQIDWGTMKHNPFVDVTKENTTLFASDRDLFIFLCDDTRPIEAGKLNNGEPDLYFRGFYVYNGEETHAGMASFMVRGVCQNRNLWGQEQFKECQVRHTPNAANNFYKKATPILLKYTGSSSKDFEEQAARAQALLIANSDEERVDFLLKQGFKKPVAAEIIEITAREEGHPMQSLYDAVQGTSALARKKANQNERLKLEQKSTELLELAA